MADDEKTASSQICINNVALTPVGRAAFSDKKSQCSPTCRKLQEQAFNETHQCLTFKSIECSVSEQDMKHLTELAEAKQKVDELEKEKNELVQQLQSISEINEKSNLQLYRLQQEIENKNLEIIVLKQDRDESAMGQIFEDQYSRKQEDRTKFQLTKSDSIPEESKGEELTERIEFLERTVETLKNELAKHSDIEKNLLSDAESLKMELDLTKELLEIQTLRANEVSAICDDILNEYTNVSESISLVMENMKSWQTDFQMELGESEAFQNVFDENSIEIKKLMGLNLEEEIDRTFSVTLVTDAIFNSLKDTINSLSAEKVFELNKLYEQQEHDFTELINTEQQISALSEQLYSYAKELLRRKDSDKTECHDFNEELDAIKLKNNSLEHQVKTLHCDNQNLNACFKAISEDLQMKDNALKTNVETIEQLETKCNKLSTENGKLVSELVALTAIKLGESMMSPSVSDQNNEFVKLENVLTVDFDSTPQINESNEVLCFEDTTLWDQEIALNVKIDKEEELSSFAKHFSDYLKSQQVFHPDEVLPSDSSVFYFLLDRYLDVVRAYYELLDKFQALKEDLESDRNETVNALSLLACTNDMNLTSSFESEIGIQSSTMCDRDITFATTIVDERSQDPLELTRDRIRSPMTPLTAFQRNMREPVTPIQQIRNIERLSSVKKSVTFRSPLLAKTSGTDAEKTRLKKLLDEKMSNCGELEKMIATQKMEIIKLKEHADKEAIKASSYLEDLGKTESEYAKENELLQKERDDAMINCNTFKERLIKETIDMDPSLTSQLQESSLTEVLNLFIETIIQRCQTLQDEQKETFAKDRNEWLNEKLRLTKVNQSLEENVRQLQFELRSMTDQVGREKLELESQLDLIQQEKADLEIIRKELENEVQLISKKMLEKDEDISKLTLQFDNISSENTELEKQMAEKEGKIKQLELTIDALENELNSMEKIASDKMNSIENDLRKLIAQKEKYVEEIIKECDSKSDKELVERDRLLSELQFLEQRLSIVNEERALFEKGIRSEIEQLIEKLNESERLLNDFKEKPEKLSELEDALQQKNKDHAKLCSAIELFYSDLAKLPSFDPEELSLEKNQLADHAIENFGKILLFITCKVAELKETKKSFETHELDLQSVKKELVNLSSAIEASDNMLLNVREEKHQLESKLLENTQLLDCLNVEIETLTEAESMKSKLLEEKETECLELKQSLADLKAIKEKEEIEKVSNLELTQSIINEKEKLVEGLKEKVISLTNVEKELQNIINGLNMDVKALREELEASAKEINCHNERIRNMEEEKEGMVSKVLAIENELTLTKEKLALATESEQRYTLMLEAKEIECNKLSKTIEQTKSDIAAVFTENIQTMTTERDEFQARFAEKVVELNQAEDRSAAVIKESNYLNSVLLCLNTFVQSLKAQLQDATQEKKNLAEKIEILQSEKIKLTEENQDYASDLARKEQLLAELKETEDSMSMIVEVKSEECLSLKSSLESLSPQIEMLKNELEAIRANKNEIEEQLYSVLSEKEEVYKSESYLRKKCTELEKEVENLATGQHLLKIEGENLKQEIMEKDTLINLNAAAAIEEREALLKEVNELTTAKEMLAFELKKIEMELAGEKDTVIRELHEELKQMMTEKNEIASNLEEAQQKYHHSVERISELEKCINELKAVHNSTLINLQAEKRKLEDNLAIIKAGLLQGGTYEELTNVDDVVEVMKSFKEKHLRICEELKYLQEDYNIANRKMIKHIDDSTALKAAIVGKKIDVFPDVEEIVEEVKSFKNTHLEICKNFENLKLEKNTTNQLLDKATSDLATLKNAIIDGEFEVYPDMEIIVENIKTIKNTHSKTCQDLEQLKIENNAINQELEKQTIDLAKLKTALFEKEDVLPDVEVVIAEVKCFKNKHWKTCKELEQLKLEKNLLDEELNKLKHGLQNLNNIVVGSEFDDYFDVDKIVKEVKTIKDSLSGSLEVLEKTKYENKMYHDLFKELCSTQEKESEEPLKVEDLLQDINTFKNKYFLICDEYENLKICKQNSESLIEKLTNDLNALKSAIFTNDTPDTEVVLQEVESLKMKYLETCFNLELLKTENNSFKEQCSDIAQELHLAKEEKSNLEIQFQNLTKHFNSVKYMILEKNTVNALETNEDLGEFKSFIIEHEAICKEREQLTVENNLKDELIKILKEDFITLKNSIFETDHDQAFIGTNELVQKIQLLRESNSKLTDELKELKNEKDSVEKQLQEKIKNLSETTQKLDAISNKYYELESKFELFQEDLSESHKRAIELLTSEKDQLMLQMNCITSTIFQKQIICESDDPIAEVNQLRNESQRLKEEMQILKDLVDASKYSLDAQALQMEDAMQKYNSMVFANNELQQEKDDAIAAHERTIHQLIVENDRLESNLLMVTSAVIGNESIQHNDLASITLLANLEKTNIKELTKQLEECQEIINHKSMIEKELSSAISLLKEKINTLNSTKASLTIDFEKKTYENTELFAEVDKKEKENQRLREELATAQKNMETLQGELSAANEYKEEVYALKLCLDNSDRELENLRKDKTDLQNCLTEVKEKLVKVEEMFNSAEAKNSAFAIELETVRQELMNNKNLMSKLELEFEDKYKIANENLKKELEDVKLQKFELAKCVDDYKRTEVVILRRLDEKQKSDEANAILVHEISELQAVVEQLKKSKDDQYEKLNSSIEALKETITFKEQLAKNADEKVRMSEEEISSLQNVIKKLNEEIEKLYSVIRSKDIALSEKSKENACVKQQMSLKEEENLKVQRLLEEKNGVVSDMEVRVKELNNDNAEMIELLTDLHTTLGLPEQAFHNISKKEDGKSYIRFFKDHKEHAKEILEGLRANQFQDQEKLNVELDMLRAEKVQFQIRLNEWDVFGKNQEEQIASLSKKIAALAAERSKRNKRPDIESRRIEKLEEMNKLLNDLFIQMLTKLQFPDVNKINMFSLRGLNSVTQPLLRFIDQISADYAEVQSMKSRIAELDEENQELSDEVENLFKTNNELELKVMELQGGNAALNNCTDCPELRKDIDRMNEELVALNAKYKSDIIKLEERIGGLIEKCTTLEDTISKLKKVLEDKEDQLLRAVSNAARSNEIYLSGSSSGGMVKEMDLQQQIHTLKKRNEMYKDLLRQRSQTIKELEAKCTKVTMHSNSLDSPIRERQYNLRGRKDVAAAYKKAIQPAQGIENV